MRAFFVFVIGLVLFGASSCHAVESVGAAKVYPGADERTPSYSQYYSWINNTNEGATEEQSGYKTCGYQDTNKNRQRPKVFKR